MDVFLEPFHFLSGYKFAQSTFWVNEHKILSSRNALISDKSACGKYICVEQ